jgi:hypothetical protein
LPRSARSTAPHKACSCGELAKAPTIVFPTSSYSIKALSPILWVHPLPGCFSLEKRGADRHTDFKCMVRWDLVKTFPLMLCFGAYITSMAVASGDQSTFLVTYEQLKQMYAWCAGWTWLQNVLPGAGHVGCDNRSANFSTIISHEGKQMRLCRSTKSGPNGKGM